MALLPWPAETWVLIAFVLVGAPSVGILWTPSMAMLSDGAEARGIEQGYAVALTNLAWSTGQTLGSAGGARVGEAYGDVWPYLALAGMCALTLPRSRGRGTRRRSPGATRRLSRRPTASSPRPRGRVAGPAGASRRCP